MTNWIDEIKKRLELATPGPWHIGHVNEFHPEIAEIDSNEGIEVATVSHRRDQPFIASAPMDIKNLLEEREVLREAILKAKVEFVCKPKCFLCEALAWEPKL